MWTSPSTSGPQHWCCVSENRRHCPSLNLLHPSSPISLPTSPPLFLSLPLSLFPSPSVHPLPLFQPAPPHRPTHSMRRPGEEHDLTTLPEILPQMPPPPPPTHIHARTNTHSYLPSVIPKPMHSTHPSLGTPSSISSSSSTPYNTAARP